MNIFFSCKLAHQFQLVDYLAGLFDEDCNIDILAPDEFSLPLFNQDLESSEEIVAEASRVYCRFKQADGLIVASPEYNGHVSPYLKNTVDRVSRIPRIRNQEYPENAFANKPLLLTSAATVWTGGLLGLQDARSVFCYLGCLVMQNQLCISNAENVFTASGISLNPDYAAYMRDTVIRFRTLVQKNK